MAEDRELGPFVQRTHAFLCIATMMPAYPRLNTAAVLAISRRNSWSL